MDCAPHSTATLVLRKHRLTRALHDAPTDRKPLGPVAGIIHAGLMVGQIGLLPGDRFLGRQSRRQGFPDVDAGVINTWQPRAYSFATHELGGSDA